MFFSEDLRKQKVGINRHQIGLAYRVEGRGLWLVRLMCEKPSIDLGSCVGSELYHAEVWRNGGYHLFFYIISDVCSMVKLGFVFMRFGMG